MSMADAYMPANNKIRHHMIAEVIARLTSDSAAAHRHEAQVMPLVLAQWVDPNVNEAPRAHRLYKFSNNMEGWTKFRTDFLDRFTSQFEAVQIRIQIQKPEWKPAVMELDAHIANIQNHLHYLTILDSPLSKDDQILHFIRSLNKRDFATRVKFDITMDEAIRAVQNRVANNSIHDLVVLRNPRGHQQSPPLNTTSISTTTRTTSTTILRMMSTTAIWT
jgi:hypothetical protein